MVPQRRVNRRPAIESDEVHDSYAGANLQHTVLNPHEEASIRNFHCLASATATRSANTPCAGAIVQKCVKKRKESQTGELGFEPRQTDSETVVLPLHYSPMRYTKS